MTRARRFAARRSGTAVVTVVLGSVGLLACSPPTPPPTPTTDPSLSASPSTGPVATSPSSVPPTPQTPLGLATGPGISDTTIRIGLVVDPGVDQGFGDGVRLWEQAVNTAGGLCGRTVEWVEGTGYRDVALDVAGLIVAAPPDVLAEIGAGAAADDVPVLTDTMPTIRPDSGIVAVGATADALAVNTLDHLLAGENLAAGGTLAVLDDGSEAGAAALAGARWWADRHEVSVVVRPFPDVPDDSASGSPSGPVTAGSDSDPSTDGSTADDTTGADAPAPDPSGSAPGVGTGSGPTDSGGTGGPGTGGTSSGSGELEGTSRSDDSGTRGTERTGDSSGETEQAGGDSTGSGGSGDSSSPGAAVQGDVLDDPSGTGPTDETPAVWSDATVVLAWNSPAAVEAALASLPDALVVTDLSGLGEDATSERLRIAGVAPTLGSTAPAAGMVAEAAAAAGLSTPGPRLVAGYAVAGQFARMVLQACTAADLSRPGLVQALVDMGPAAPESLLGPTDPAPAVTGIGPASTVSAVSALDPEFPSGLSPSAWPVQDPDLEDYYAG